MEHSHFAETIYIITFQSFTARCMVINGGAILLQKMLEKCLQKCGPENWQLPYKYCHYRGTS
jgi:hypothetical protein